MNLVDFLASYISPLQAALATSLLMFYFAYQFLKDIDLPPGPIGLPILGYWPFLRAETCHVQLKEMVEKYGDIFCFRSSGRLILHLGSIKSIKEAHLTKVEFFGERFWGFNISRLIFHDALIMIHGEQWTVLRKFFLSKFKEYGMNAVKESSFSSIHDVLNKTIDELRKSEGQPVPITKYATDKCEILIRRILFNDNGITIEEMQQLVHEYEIAANSLTGTNLLLFGKIAKYLIFPLMPLYWGVRRAINRIDDIFLNVINRHERSYDETQPPNIVNSFIKEREERKQKGDPTAKFFTVKALAGSLGQFLTDGEATFGLFIGGFLISVMEHPEEQEKIYKELIEVIGSERLPTIEDKPNLPYTNAFMYEVMRLSELFPLFPSQECMKETSIRGYKIPEGTVTLINFYAANRDPNTFVDPETFNPSRYLTSPNKARAELPLMFGVGKRSCIGEAFTMINAFLIFTTIVKNFHLSFPDSKVPINNIWNEERLYICAVPRS